MEQERRRRFLFVVFSEAGKLYPMLAVARHLEDKGHEIFIYSVQNDVSSHALRAGLKARSVAGARAPSLPSPETNRSAMFTEKMMNPAWAARWMASALLGNVHQQVIELRSIIGEFRPDVVVTHAMAYAGALASTLEEVPWAAASTGFMGLIPDDWDCTARKMFQRIEETRRDLFASFQVSPSFRMSDIVSPALNVTFACESVFLRHEGVQLVGASTSAHGRGDEAEFPWEKLPAGKPIVLVSFGGHLSANPGTYSALIDALKPEEAFIVLVAKELPPGELPSHVYATTHVPQLAMLKRASLMVNHAGSNSVMECLSAGVPMLMIPLLYDQPAIARYVAEAGAGVTLAPDQLSGCREILLSMLDAESPHRRRAKEIAATMPDGAKNAASLFEQIANERRA